MKKKGVIIAVAILIIVVSIVVFVLPIEIDDSMGTVYTVVRLNKLSKTIEVETTISESVVSGSPSSKTNDIATLTNEEYLKTLYVYYLRWGDRDKLLGALRAIALQDEPMVSKSDANYEANYGVMAVYDLNKDGTVTRKEFGDSYLDTLFANE